LGKDYFHFDATRHHLLGERTGQSYRLGDRVEVRVVKVDMESTKIDFVLHSDVEESDEKDTPKPKKSKGKKKHG
ncbi:MAG: hypothetical protein WC216_08960, partial [Gallionella sp.]